MLQYKSRIIFKSGKKNGYLILKKQKYTLLHKQWQAENKYVRSIADIHPQPFGHLSATLRTNVQSIADNF